MNNYNKYLKYKKKYITLKMGLVGGGDDDIVKLLSEDNQYVDVKVKVVKQSKTLNKLIKDVENIKDPIPLPNITGKILKILVEILNKLSEKKKYK